MNKQALQNTVEEYKKLTHLRNQLACFSRLVSIGEVITHAATSCCPCCNRKFDHQRRIPEDILQLQAEVLLQKEAEITKCQTFEELHEVVKKYHVSGIRELTIYDISLRIGAYLKLYPQRIYLHSGAGKGLKAWAGKLKMPFKASESITLDELKAYQADLITSELMPHEIEDFLCIFFHKEQNNTFSKIF